MKKLYPLRPLLAPALLAPMTAFALLAALLSDGVLETISLVLLAAVVGEVLVSLLWRKR
ncbi:hypothetical protein [Caulobacter sp. DWR1-3-2b1]|uniref:hypothetical protein n=1 Tax=Caulobacter sp. DWR1-3-2b1 TaxID=2804670 RepID=UPI003CEE241F